MYRLQILRQAREDMQNSADWYNDKQDGLGLRFLLEIIRTLRLVEANPLQYEEKYSRNFRFAKVNTFPFVIVFKVKEQFLIISAVFHTSRNPKKFIK